MSEFLKAKPFCEPHKVLLLQDDNWIYPIPTFYEKARASSSWIMSDFLKTPD
jgi:hypothetical protein